MTRTLTCIFAIISMASPAIAQIEDFDSIKIYTLKNANGVRVTATNYGAILTSIVVPDRDGETEDIALGYYQVEDYINAVDKTYFGSVVGRYGRGIPRQLTITGDIHAHRRQFTHC